MRIAADHRFVQAGQSPDRRGILSPGTWQAYQERLDAEGHEIPF